MQFNDLITQNGGTKGYGEVGKGQNHRLYIKRSKPEGSPTHQTIKSNKQQARNLCFEGLWWTA